MVAAGRGGPGHQPGEPGALSDQAAATPGAVTDQTAA